MTAMTVIEVHLKYLTFLRDNKKANIFNIKSSLTRRFPNLSPKQADAIFRIWLIENPYRYLEKTYENRSA
jgi:hypothetical protein